MKKEYGLIDILKLLFAIGILGIHALLFESKDTFTWVFLHAVLRLGVPFFFCVSGFFFYRSLKSSDNDKDVRDKYLKRLLIPFIFWLLMNLPLVIYNYHVAGDGISMILLKLVRGLIFYPWGAMWYVYALIIAIIVIFPFYNSNKLKAAVFIGAILYLIALISNTYYFLIQNTILEPVINLMLKVMSSTRNGIFEGMYFVSVGMYISKLSSENKISYSKNNILFFILYILLIVEVILTKNYTHADDHSLFLTYVILIPSLLIFVKQFNINVKTHLLRNYSTGIYFVHRFILALVTLTINTNNNVLIFSLTLLITIVLLSLFYKINNTMINKIIK